MLAATFAVIWPPLGGQAHSAPISPSGAAAFAGSPSAQQIGWRGCGFWQAKCAVRWGPAKLDRSAANIDRLMEDGQKRAREFLEARRKRILELAERASQSAHA
jgi:hypothetical protein